MVMPKAKAPSEGELLEACVAAKDEHPEFGVKRVFNHIMALKPGWRLTERRVQKVMRANAMTAGSGGGGGGGAMQAADDDDEASGPEALDDFEAAFS